MSFADKKGISVASGFKLQAQAPIDARFQVKTIQERDELVSIKAAYPGLTVYVTDAKTMYVYNGSGWDEMAKGAGYTHPTTPGYKHIPAGGAAGQILKWKADGEAQWAAEKSYNKVTTSADGLMSKEDKNKLDVIADGANKTIVDAALNDTSINPVQNKIVKAELDKKLAASLKGAANGLAELDSAGKVPAAQLPSYVDDVLEFDNKSAFPETGESGKIYVAKDSNKTYRWSGTAFVEISASLALGETASTAYRGDRGKTAYDHSQLLHAPADAEKNVQADWNVSDINSDAFIKNKPTSLPADGGNADTVEGHTVKTDVPENAKFTDTTYSAFKGASASTKGGAGLVPAPEAGAQDKILHGDGTWQTEKTYSHPANHPASMITQDADHRFVTDTEKAKWNKKPEIFFGSGLPETAPAGSVCFLI